MIKIGQFNSLKVIKEVAFGVYLNGLDAGEILLPNKVVPKNTQVNDVLEVFIYFDSEDRMIATTSKPLGQVGKCAYLKVIDVNPVGAFLNWGLDKDLLVPRPEQYRPMEKNKSYLVYLTQDHQGRIVGSSKLDAYLSKTPPHYKPGEEVNLLIAEATNLGNKVIVNHTHWGLIHTSDIFQRLIYGQTIQGYIKAIREDGKIDVVLRKIGQDSIEELAARILLRLQENAGFIPLHDKSSALDIEKAFSESKKSFKRAIGLLYKQGKIIIESEGIRIK